MATSLDLARTYTSYSGVDIRVVINGAQVGSMQALSYAIQREKAPIYVMGSVDPVSYSRGKRGIAGTMISLMMDTHILMSPSFTGEYYLGDSDEIFPQMVDTNLAKSSGTTGLNNLDNELNSPVSLTTLGGAQFSAGSVVKPFGTNVKQFPGSVGTQGESANPYQRVERSEKYQIEDISNNYRVAPVFYVDQILPFDIAIVAANEYGQSAQMRLYGCEILNEGSGFSIDDIVIENQMTYVCRTILPWRSFEMKARPPTTEGKNVIVRNELYGRLGSMYNRGDSAGGESSPIEYRFANNTIRRGRS